MGNIHILLYYKFAKVENPNLFAKKHLELCNNLELLGKILIAEEGINGSVSGTKDQTDKYQEELRKLPGFEDIVFKEEIGKLHPFNKMVVKVKKEIIRLDQELDMKKTGKYLSPEEFLEIYDKDVIILDTRNDYESKVGKFKKAITPEIKNFRDFPKVAKMLEDKKDKKIVMYCTGGIRCEKASAYLIKEGFKDVSQLEGGIITFCQKFPKTLWEGKCFVFDKRVLSSVDSENPLLEKCLYCNSDCDLYENCNNRECNKLVSICPDCKKNNDCCCSEECQSIYKNFLLKKSIINFGKKSKIISS